jgi:hypothetical protein
MANKNAKKTIIIFSIVFVLSYILLYILSATKLINNINSPWSNHLFIIAFFCFGYFLFDYLQKEINFNFAEIYIGVILLIILYLAFYMAYWVYYSQTTNVFSYLIDSPYIHIAISFFAGWLTFFFINFDFKK